MVANTKISVSHPKLERPVGDDQRQNQERRNGQEGRHQIRPCRKR